MNLIPEIDAASSLIVNLNFYCERIVGEPGLDIVFLIDNSGTMKDNDPSGYRITAIRTLAGEFQYRTQDRIAIVEFSGCTGDGKTRVYPDGSSWRSWSQVIADLADTSDMNSGATPMHEGMEVANSLFRDDDPNRRFYRIVIMMSDGEPRGCNPDPLLDAYNTERQGNIIRTERLQTAGVKRIIYSTVFLNTGSGSSESQVIARELLEDIAKGTQAWGSPSFSGPIKYYFETSDPADLIDKYRQLFEDLSTTLQPINVEIKETLPGYLRIDTSVEPEFVGNLKDSISRETPLDEAIEKFKIDGEFYIKCDAMEGHAFLRFAVTVNLSDPVIQDAIALDFDSIKKPVDDLNNCRLRHEYWSEVEEKVKTHAYCDVAEGEALTDVFPQREVKILLGTKIKKCLTSPDTIDVGLSHLATQEIDWAWIKECPSNMVDIVAVRDNYEFSPFRLIFYNLIYPFMLMHCWSSAGNQLTPGFSWTYDQLPPLPDAVDRKIGDIANKIDSLLCQFNFTGEASVWKGYWSSYNPRGIFKTRIDIQSGESYSLEVDVRGASYSEGIESAEINHPINYESKDTPLSRYEYLKGVYHVLGHIQPNPFFNQIVYPGPRPDLSVRTCFDYDGPNQIDEFYMKLIYQRCSYSNLQTRLAVLNNSSIVHITPSHTRIEIENCGGCAGSTTAHIESFFFKWPKVDFDENDVPKPDSLIILPPITRSGSLANVNILQNSTKKILLEYESPSFSPSMLPSVEVKDFSGFIVDIVTLDKAESADAKEELMLCNNQAINIIQTPTFKQLTLADPLDLDRESRVVRVIPEWER